MVQRLLEFGTAQIDQGFDQSSEDNEVLWQYNC